jgi:hypothetical protein
MATDPTLEDVFLDATGRTRGRVEGDALFIPLFFLAVNVGQVAKDLPGRRSRAGTSTSCARHRCRGRRWRWGG